MGVFGDVVKSFVTLALSDSVVDDNYRLGLEQASKHYLNAVESRSDAEFKKVFQILQALDKFIPSDASAIINKYQLLIQTHLKVAEIALENLQLDLQKADGNAQTPDEEKPVNSLHLELANIIQHLEAAEVKKDYLLRQSYSVKNDAELKDVKSKILQLKQRKHELENAILMATSRGAEKKVMKSAYENKINIALRATLECLVELNGITDFSSKNAQQKTELISNAKKAIEYINNALKEAVH